MTLKRFALCVKLAAVWPVAAQAHVSEGGFVLLLPTGAYTAAGVAVVALTVLLVVFGSDRLLARLFAAGPSWRVREPVAQATSLAAVALTAALVWLGLFGPRDPLGNLLPLTVWTVGWVGLVSLAGLVGNPWVHWNPWTGLYRVLGSPAPVLRLPDRLGLWPAVVTVMALAAFLLAYWAPSDPGRLAVCLALYWVAMMAGLLVAGPRWLEAAEVGHVIMGLYGRLAPLHVAPGQRALGGPGAQVLRAQPASAAGLVAVLLLGLGSFDGLNETFWWLGLIGVNPLEFPGRSAIVGETLAGLALASAALVASVAVAVWAGLRMAGGPVRFSAAFNWLGLSLLPIALAYHIAHYLPSFLVTIQYTVAALTDPLARGADLLGIEPFRVTTGFFNRMETVRVIWLAQAGAVVVGHVWSVLLSHAIALRLYDDRHAAVRATLPLSAFMVGYTFLGLWLLASAKGA